MFNSINNNPLVTLQFNQRSSNQISQFPTDPNADITIILASSRINYSLQKSVLRHGSQYFLEYFTNERTENSNIMLISRRFDQSVFESVLRCFYGGTYQIFKSQDVYVAYQVCKYLQIETFTKLIEQSILEDFSRYQFLYVYQLAEMYQINDVKLRCLDYLDSDPYAFKKILDINEIKINYIKTKQLLGSSTLNKDYAGKPPTTLLLLQEEPFRNLIRIHNQFKQVKQNGLLSYDEIYQILRLYTEIRTNDIGDLRARLRKLVIELVDRDLLSANEYLLIYHQDLQLSQTVFENNFSAEVIMFDPTLSEIFLLKKQLVEAKSESQRNTLELRKAREALELSIRASSKQHAEVNRLYDRYEMLLKQVQEKVGTLERELVTMQIINTLKDRQIEDKDKEINEMHRIYDEIKYDDQMNGTVESELFIKHKQNLNDSQFIHDTEQILIQRVSIGSLRNSICSKYIFIILIQKRKVVFDHTPQTVNNSKDLDCLLDFFSVSLFEKINLKLIYRGSRDGFDAGSMQTYCKFQTDLVVLVRSLEYHKVFGFYIRNETKVQCEPIYDEKLFLFSVTHQKKIRQQSQAKLQFFKTYVEVGNDLQLFKNQCNYPIDFEKVEYDDNSETGAEFLVGNKEFQIAEIEVFKMVVSRAMDII